MRRADLAAGLLAGLLLLAGAGTALAADAPAEAPAEAPADAGTTDRTAARASFEDAVSVEDALPYVPDSNTVAAKLPLPLAETPASVAVVPAALLAEQHATVLGDALANVSGVNVQTGNGIYDVFVLRGIESVAAGLILTDGAPEPESAFYQLYNVERVEVMKGPTAFLYGGSPLAGTVNLVRKQPLPGRFVSFSAGAGSFGALEGAADANFAAADGRLSFRVNGVWREEDGYRDGREAEERAVNPALTWRPDEDTFVNVSFETLDLDRAPDSGLPVVAGAGGLRVVGVPRERSYQSPFDVSEHSIDRFQVDFETRLGGGLVLRNKAYYRGFDWLSRASSLNGVFPTGAGFAPEVARTLLVLDDRQEFVGDQFEAVSEFTTGRVGHSLLAGVEVTRMTDRFDFGVGLLPSIDLFSPVERSPASLDQVFFLPSQARSADAETLVVAPYFVDQIRLGERFRLLLGARFDRLDFEDEVSGVDRTDSELSPLAGLVFLPRPGWSLYANAGSAFAPPSTFSVAEDQVPEESEQVEVGVKRSLLGGKVLANAALYRLERTNVAIPDQTGVTRQTGDQRAEGVELELTALPRPGLRLFATYAYTDAELTEFRELVVDPFTGGFAILDRTGNDPAFVPEHLGSLWVSQRLPAGFTLAGGARWTGEQAIDEDNAFLLDDTVTLHAAVSWERGPWKLRVNLDNLADEEVLTRGFGGTSVIPAPGFAAFSALEVAF